MLPPCLFITLHKYCIIRIKEKDLISDPVTIHCFQIFLQSGKILSTSHIQSQSYFFHLCICILQHLDKSRKKRDRQIVHAKISHILKHLQSRRLSCSRHSRNDNKTHPKTLLSFSLPAPALLRKSLSLSLQLPASARRPGLLSHFPC